MPRIHSPIHALTRTAGSPTRVVRTTLERAVLLVIALGCASHGAPMSGHPAAAPSASDIASIRAVLDSTAAGWNRGDLGAYMAAYADSTTSMGANGLVHGKAATEQVMRQGFWKTGRPLESLHYEHVEVRMLGADHALATGEFVLTGAGRPDRTGWFTTVWARTTSGWRMIHDHSS